MHFRLRTLLILLAVGPPMLAAAYFSPRLTFAFLVLLACAAFSDWLARGMAARLGHTFIHVLRQNRTQTDALSISN